ncbi:hypothetical protein RHECNPAF_890035 [Rhizobium etli CNPAF512]|nr:hypothetical protein RHECNPAF_890035 [Rhizobium etli CNPAF512]
MRWWRTRSRWRRSATRPGGVTCSTSCLPACFGSCRRW